MARPALSGLLCRRSGFVEEEFLSALITSITGGPRRAVWNSIQGSS